MRPWIKRTLIGVFGASVLFGGAAAYSHCHRGPWGANMTEAEQAKWRERLVERASRKLDLDAAQKAKLSLLAEAWSTQRKAVAAQGGEARSELKAVLAGAQFDRNRAQALIDTKAAAVRSASPAVVAAAADFYDSLKPEQQDKVRSLLERGGRHGWRG
ncbi:Spy/CpxP family protein refolding chaperone [Sphaerotilaceae bacterium SBD11-9]